jgi:glucokinase
MRTAIGVDVGGSRIKAVLVGEAGEVLAETTAPTNDGLPPVDGVPLFALSAKSVVKELCENAERAPDCIGIAAPGLAARDGRSIAYMPGRMAGLENLDWTRLLDRETAVPVLNDAHAALLGETKFGAARGVRDAILLTLGTGVGGAILADGRLLKGTIGRAGHLGHISLNPDGPLDIVHTPGSLEDLIGDCTVRRRSDGRFAHTVELLEAVRAGDDGAFSVWSRSVYHLACAIASLVNVLDPEVVVIGGGIAKAGADLFGPLERFIERVEWRPQGHRVKIVPAALDDRAGALGAAFHALDCARTGTAI